MKINPINVFTPASEVQEIARFAGRGTELESLAIALQSKGSQIVLYGQRGVGKSSLARQLVKMATNDAYIMDRLKNKPHDKLDFIPIYLACDDSVKSVEALMLRLLTSDDGLAP